MKKVLATLLFLLMLLPSAWYAWRNREMPQFGRSHDDAIQYIAAKSLAEGHGYRILSLPGAPFETKFPPLVPWMLALAWKIEPRFPNNLTIATAMQWSILPLFLWLTFVWLGRAGLSRVQRWVGLGLLAISPYTASFGGGISTEPLFGVFLLLSLMAMEEAMKARKGANPEEGRAWQWAAAAGLAAGLACLTRTAGVVALVSGPAVFLWWKMRREAVAFALGILPGAAGWAVWAKLHRVPATDLSHLYNTDYVGYYFLNMHWRDLGPVMWKNVGHALYAIGGLPFPMEMDSYLWQLVHFTVGIAILVGLVRHWKRAAAQSALLPYLAFGAISLAQLLVWDWTPNLRLMYPLVPLFLAGLLWEAEHFWQLLRQSRQHKERSQRIAGWLVGAVAVGLVVVAIGMPVYMAVYQLPASIADNERVRDENRHAYQWIAKNVDPKARFLLVNPALYLYTGHQAGNIVSMEINWYRDDQARALALFQELPAYASAHGFDYVFLHQADYAMVDYFGEPEKARHALESSPGIRAVFQDGNTTLFQATGAVASAGANTAIDHLH